MLTVEELRKRKGWTVSQLGRATGLDRRLLTDLERGIALAKPEVLELLENHGVTGLACTNQVLHKKDLRGLPLRRFERPEYNLEAWDRALQAYPGLFAKLSSQQRAFLKNYVRADSALECYLWVKILLAGGKLRLANPHACGFRKLPVVDETGDALGERLLPCIHWKRGSLEVIIWPQVHLRPDKWTFRVDALILRVSPNPQWCTLEVDGPGHNPSNDDFRSAQLLKETIRLTKEHLQRPTLIGDLAEQLLAA